MNANLSLNLTNERTINEATEAVEKMYEVGCFTAEERAVALGNLAEARAKLRLTLASN